MVARIIGKSYENRDIIIYEYFVDKPKFNVLLTGSVHGNEYPGGLACWRLMEDITANPTFYNDVNIVVLPFWNIDGTANGTRYNAQGYEIAYSTINLVTPEMRVLHEYLINNKYYPDFYIDNHNLDRYNRGVSFYLYDHVPRLALAESVVIAMNTSSIGSRHKMGWNQWTDLVKYVQDNVGPNYTINKFWEFSDEAAEILKYNEGYDIGEFQNFLAVRYDTLSFLIEGVAPEDYTNYDDPGWEPCIQSQFLTNKYMIDWTRTRHLELVQSKCCPPYLGEKIPINKYYALELFPDRIKVQNDSTGSAVYLWPQLTWWRLNQPEDTNKYYTTAPLAYAVHNTNEEEVNIWLKYFGFEWTQGLAGDTYDTEQFHCTAADPWYDAEGDIPYQVPQTNRNGYYVPATRTNFSQYTIFPVEQFAGDTLVHLCEALSETNLSAFQTLFPTLELVPNDDYPILRLIRRR